jgi:hypothetical protein
MQISVYLGKLPGFGYLRRVGSLGTVFSSAPLPPQTARSLVGGRSGTRAPTSPRVWRSLRFPPFNILNSRLWER